MCVSIKNGVLQIIKCNSHVSRVCSWVSWKLTQVQIEATLLSIIQPFNVFTEYGFWFATIGRGSLSTLDRHKQQFISGNEPASLAPTLLRNTGFEMRTRTIYVYLCALLITGWYISSILFYVTSIVMLPSYVSWRTKCLLIQKIIKPFLEYLLASTSITNPSFSK